MVLQRGGSRPATHLGHQGNAQALRALGRSHHHDGGHQSNDLSPPMGRQSRRPERLEHQALTCLLALEDVYQNKNLCTLSLF
jgi:hypothetical protein